MPDLLAHVFIAYSVCRVLSLRWDWLTSQYVTVGMVGAFIPDLVKLDLVIPADVMEQTLGIPFSWGSLATGGGTFLSVLIGVVLSTSIERRRAGLLLGIGAGSHLLADSLLLTPTGHSVQLFWPVFQYRVPSPGLYLSTQPGPTIVSGGMAALAWILSHYRLAASPGPTDE